MKVGDFIVRKQHMDDAHCFGLVVNFDKDGDPYILWNGGFIEEEYKSAVEVTSRPKDGIQV